LEEPAQRKGKSIFSQLVLKPEDMRFMYERQIASRRPYTLTSKELFAGIVSDPEIDGG
jgi:hypothetical protein